MLKQKFFKLPIIFRYSYKSIFFNVFAWKKILITNTFWTSLSRFSYKLTSKQPVKISTLKLIKNRDKILYFFNKIITTESWCTFTTTDIQDIYLSAEELKKTIEKKFNLKKDFEIFLIEKKFISFLLKYEELFYCSNLGMHTSVHNYKYFFDNKSIFGSSISTDIYYFLYKLFSFSSTSRNQKEINTVLTMSDNKIFYKRESVLDFFHQIWIFIFFPNKLNKFTKFLYLFDLAEKLKIMNGLIFHNGLLFFFNDLGLLKFCKKNNYNWFFWKKKISTLLNNLFLLSLKSTQFIAISNHLLILNKYNIYYYMLTSFYYFNTILISFFLPSLLKVRLNSFLINLFKAKLNIFFVVLKNKN